MPKRFVDPNAVGGLERHVSGCNAPGCRSNQVGGCARDVVADGGVHKMRAFGKWWVGLIIALSHKCPAAAGGHKVSHDGL